MKKYEKPELEIIKFDNVDIITDSDGGTRSWNIVPNIVPNIAGSGE